MFSPPGLLPSPTVSGTTLASDPSDKSTCENSPSEGTLIIGGFSPGRRAQFVPAPLSKSWILLQELLNIL